MLRRLVLMFALLIAIPTTALAEPPSKTSTVDTDAGRITIKTDRDGSRITRHDHKGNERASESTRESHDDAKRRIENERDRHR